MTPEEIATFRAEYAALPDYEKAEVNARIATLGIRCKTCGYRLNSDGSCDMEAAHVSR